MQVSIYLVKGKPRGSHSTPFRRAAASLPAVATGVALLQFYTLLKMQASYPALLIGHIGIARFMGLEEFTGF
jgi:ABC-type spermidine/putrescine transport system permease subunit II